MLTQEHIDVLVKNKVDNGHSEAVIEKFKDYATTLIGLQVKEHIVENNIKGILLFDKNKGIIKL